MSVSLPPTGMSTSPEDGRGPRLTSAESRSGSPYLTQQNAVQATIPPESSATYRPVPLTRSTSADNRQNVFPRGRTESPEVTSFHQGPRPRVPSEAGSEGTMGARARGGTSSLGIPGNSRTQAPQFKLGGSVGIPGASGMPLQSITSMNSRSRASDTNQVPQRDFSSPAVPRQRSMTDQAVMMSGHPQKLGGSVGVPGRPDLGRSGSFQGIERGFQGTGSFHTGTGHDRDRIGSMQMSGHERDRVGTMSMPGSGTLGGSVGMTGKLGGSVGIPGGPPGNRIRSQTEPHIQPSSLNSTLSSSIMNSQGGRGRSTSPSVDNLEPPGSGSIIGTSNRPRSVSVDNRGDESSYIPRTPSEVQQALGRNDYLPLDRATTSGNVNGSIQQPIPIEEPKNERDTSWYKIAAMFAAWGFCVVAWIAGVTQTFSTLNVLPNTPMYWHMTRSALHTLEDLREKQCWFALYALAFFSLVIPIGKISGTGYLIYKLTSRKAYDILKEHNMKIHAFSYFASYQFVDLYCGMLFVCFFTSEASSTLFGIGFYWFFCYCIASLMLSVFLDTVLMESEPTEAESEPARPLIEHLEEPMSSRGERHERHPSNFEELSRGAKVEHDDEEARTFSAKDNVWSATPPWSKDREQHFASVHTYKAHKDYFPELWSTRFFAIVFFIMMLLSPWDYFLEVRMILHTIAVERTVMSLRQVLCDLLPGKIHVAVIFMLWMLVVFMPFLYASMQLVRVEAKRRYKDDEMVAIGSIRVSSRSFQYWTKLVADFSRQWSHVDVVGIAALVFLFMVQDNTTLTMVPDGKFQFYFFIAAAASFMFLRWFTETEVSEESSFVWAAAPKARSIFLVAIYIIFIALIWGGVPGAAPHFKYRSLASVCQHARPFLHKVRAQLPASYGNCGDTLSHPPKPCVGDTNLQTQGNDKQYMNAIWIGGLRTMDVHTCDLQKVQNPTPGMSEYQFRIAGEFEKLSLYLRVKQCMPMGGCVKMNSADHCCGKHIGFNFTFSIDCKSAPGSLNAIRNLELVDAKFGKMIVHQDMLGGTMHVEAMDISGQVTNTVKSHIKEMLHMSIPWGGHNRSIATMLNKLVQFNAPTDAGRCL